MACHFQSLPQEVKDMIYALTYTKTGSKLSITGRSWWEIMEENKPKADRANYKIMPLPHQVNAWLVCKEFFIGAAQAYISAQTWEADALMCSDILARFVRDLGIVQDVSVSCLEACLSVTELSVDGDEWMFDNDLGKDVWEDKLDACVFESLRFTDHVLRIPNLRMFSIRRASCEFANTETKEATWSDNVKTYETYIRWKLANRARGEQEARCVQTANGRTPLYPGSLVFYGNSLSQTNDKSVARPSSSPTQAFRGPPGTATAARKLPLTDADIPSTKEGWRKLTKEREDDFFVWTCSKASGIA